MNTSTFAFLLAAFTAAHVPLPTYASTPARRAEEFPLERQVLWQRSLDDARAIAQAENRPILVAVNMDGESASERIVRERYRDPAWVAMTRPFVCVIASAFRHTPRDHDDEGRRIACPRIGEVTCGEHILLEPVLYDAHLGGERISPRHALVLRDGRKEFDLFLLFDLRDLDRALAEAAPLAPAPGTRNLPATSTERAGARDHRGRLAFEEAVLGARDPAAVDEALGAIERAGDAGSVDALGILLARGLAPVQVERVRRLAVTLGIEAGMSRALLRRISSLGPYPGAPGLGQDAELLPLLAQLDGSSAATRTFLLAASCIGAAPDRARAEAGLSTVLAPLDRPRVAEAIAREGGCVDVQKELEAVRANTSLASPVLAAANDLPDAASLERELEDLDAALKTRPDDPDAQARYGRASLSLARRRMEAEQAGAQFLLQDAELWLARASTTRPADASLLVDRARTAFYLGKFEEQEKLGIEAARLGGVLTVEAERWIGDACARQLGSRSGGDPAAEAAGILRGARALFAVAADASAGESDGLALASFLGALGLRREELACLQAAVERLPESDALRRALNDALWRGGRIDLAAPKAEWIAVRHPESGSCAWWAGFGSLLAAEDLRRAERPDAAIERYLRAERWFSQFRDLRPDAADTSSHYLALCALGRGFAHLLAEDRAQAGQCLVEGIALRPAVAAARDGLDREAIDLLDGALEWRAGGRSPVDAIALAKGLEIADPGNAAWARSIADSELREGLRAAGRGEEAEADRYLELSIEAARRASAIDGGPEGRRALAQSLTVQAERSLERADASRARPLLFEAAELLGEGVPAADADAKALAVLAETLREKLGAARPRFRPGR